MLALTRRTDYALVTLAHLAGQHDRLCSAREIADRFHMPAPMLTNILKTLTQAGLVRSERGVRGGYRLGLLPKKISLRRIMEAIEGPFRLVHCATGSDEPDEMGCDVEPWCPVQAPVRRVHDAVHQYLETITLDQIIGHQEPAPIQATVMKE